MFAASSNCLKGTGSLSRPLSSTFAGWLPLNICLPHCLPESVKSVLSNHGASALLAVSPFELARLVPQPFLHREAQNPGPKGSTLCVEMQLPWKNSLCGYHWKIGLDLPKKSQLIPKISN